MNYLKQLFLAVVCLLAGIVSAVPASADDDGQVGYNIQAILPENQVNKEHSFFDLRMKPNQEQTIEFVINNTSSETAEFEISINQAYTNDQGFIDYADKDVPPDSSQKYLINDIATTDNQVTVQASSSKIVPIRLKMPSEQFDGQILAGIQVTKQPKDTKAEKGRISNVYGYVLGLKLTETDQEVPRDLKLLGVEGAAAFGKTSVVAVLQNPTMDAYGELKYKAKVMNKASGEVEKEAAFDNHMQIAPNSQYRFAIDWGGDKLVAGDYTLDLTVSDAKENVWEFTEAFTITAEEAKKINEATIGQAGASDWPLWLYVIGGIVLGMLILGIVWYGLWKKRKPHS